MTLVLIWEDSVSEESGPTRTFLAETLAGGARQIHLVSDDEAASNSLSTNSYALLVMPFLPEAIARIHRDHPALPILVIGKGIGSAEAIEAVQGGAFDSLSWPCSPDELRALATEALAHSHQEEELCYPATPLGTGELVGNSRAMGVVYREIAKLAATPVTVLIRGETGTGKELIANALWQHGHRAHHQFVVVNCAAIPDNLLESELFGYERGAFTGAHTARKGKFEQAHGGTLFLDEIGDMGLPLQAKMLRVLQEKRIERVGGRGEIAIDVRVIAATHQPLERMIDEGTFREDLFYRLQAAALTLPPLRDRLGDVETLTMHFLRRFSDELSLDGKISREAISYLSRQSWPGNVRQLQNVLRRALLKRRELVIGREDLKEFLQELAPSPSASELTLDELADRALTTAESLGEGSALRSSIAQFEEVLIRKALARSGGNQSKAARWLGVTRLTLREKLKNLPK